MRFGSISRPPAGGRGKPLPYGFSEIVLNLWAGKPQGASAVSPLGKVLFCLFPPVQNGRTLVPLLQPGLDVGDGVGGGELHLLAGGQVLHSAHAGGDLILTQEHGVGDGQLIGVGDLLLELLLLPVDLGADAGLPQLGGQESGITGRSM